MSCDSIVDDGTVGRVVPYRGSESERGGSEHQGYLGLTSNSPRRVGWKSLNTKNIYNSKQLIISPSHATYFTFLNESILESLFNYPKTGKYAGQNKDLKKYKNTKHLGCN